MILGRPNLPMDYRELIATHRQTQADVTIAVLPVSREQVSGFGIVRLDDTGRVIGFQEKPKSDDQLAPLATPEEWMARRGIVSRGRPFLASMGIYLFNRETLVEMLQSPPLATDFGREVIPQSINTHRVQAHLFDGY